MCIPSSNKQLKYRIIAVDNAINTKMNMKKKKFVVMTLSLVFVEKLLQVGLVPEIVVSNNPYYFHSSFTSSPMIKKFLGFCKYCMVRFFRLPGYEVYWLCKKNNIKVWPKNLVNEQSFADLLNKMDLDYAFVHEFRILKEKIFSIPRFGTFNLHPSLLPQHKGATPHDWVVFFDKKETGVTIHYVTKDIDSGGIIEQHRIPLSGLDTAANLASYVVNIGTDVFIRFIFRLMHEGAPKKVISIKNKKGTYEKPFNKGRCEIKQSHPIEKINRIIRSSDGNAFFVYEGREYKILYEIEVEVDLGLEQNLPTMVEGNIHLKNSEGKNIVLVVNKSSVGLKAGLVKNLIHSLKKRLA